MTESAVLSIVTLHGGGGRLVAAGVARLRREAHGAVARPWSCPSRSRRAPPASVPIRSAPAKKSTCVTPTSSSASARTVDGARDEACRRRRERHRRRVGVARAAVVDGDLHRRRSRPRCPTRRPRARRACARRRPDAVVSQAIWKGERRVAAGDVAVDQQIDAARHRLRRSRRPRRRRSPLTVAPSAGDVMATAGGVASFTTLTVAGRDVAMLPAASSPRGDARARRPRLRSYPTPSP